MIVQSSQPVTLVGGADVTATNLDEVLIKAPTLVAADGGANALARFGVCPAVVIGDLDSLNNDARVAFADRLHLISEQNTTDFDKALRHIEAPLILALGVLGGRFDHDLAAMHVLLARPEQRCIAIGTESIVFLCPPKLHLKLEADTLVSLFPFAASRVQSEGLYWPTDGIEFSPAAVIGTSNLSTGPVTLEADGPALLVILPREALDIAIEALGSGSADAQWPARAR